MNLHAGSSIVCRDQTIDDGLIKQGIQDAFIAPHGTDGERSRRMCLPSDRVSFRPVSGQDSMSV